MNRITCSVKMKDYAIGHPVRLAVGFYIYLTNGKLFNQLLLRA